MMSDIIYVVGCMALSLSFAYIVALVVISIIEWKSIIFTIQCLALISMAEVRVNKHNYINLTFETYKIVLYVQCRKILMYNEHNSVLLYDPYHKYFYTDLSSILLYNRIFKTILNRVQ